ncbi:hypothetical protein ACFGVR_20050 [Mucilaginibacter sp. AW1-3]
MLKKLIILGIGCCMLPVVLLAQDADTTIRAKYIDSIKNSTYPYIFPAWAKKIVKRGIDLPLPAGVMVNYFKGSQQMLISDLQVGFNNNPLVPLDFIKFGEVKANLQTLNSRVDVWVLPFVGVYGIFGITSAETHVSVVEPFSFSTTANFKGTTAGVGITVAGAYRGILAIGDYNNMWTSLDNIKGAVYSQQLSIRLGHPFHFKKRPDRVISVWAGTSAIFVSRTTEGTIPLSGLSSDASQDALQKIKDETAAWYQTLTPPQKVVVKQIAEALLAKLNGIDIKNSSVSYSLIKQATHDWNMIVGGQFQLNHRWQFRTETGFFGGRSSLLLSGNYRFGF